MHPQPILQGKRHLDTDLQRLPFLDERIAEGFEIEGGVVGVREVAAPEAEVDFILTDADAGVERKVKVLGDVVVFGPEDLARAVQLG